MIGYEALTTSVAIVRDVPVGLVVLDGPDALTFLQSLASQDLADLAIGETRHSLLLEPQGKLVADFHVLRAAAETLVLRCEPAVAPQLAAGLTRFRIRVKVDIADRSDAVRALVVRGPAAAGVAIDVPADVWALRIDWPERPGIELVGPPTALAALADGALATIAPADQDALEAVRVEAGIPRQPDDIDERTIAQEANLERTAVSFTKGCFVGQELVCRIDSRGHVNRTLRRLLLDAPAAVGAEVVVDGRVVGTVTSTAVSPVRGPMALATLRREVEAGAVVAVGPVAGRTLD